jgi:hypothetical protein
MCEAPTMPKASDRNIEQQSMVRNRDDALGWSTIVTLFALYILGIKGNDSPPLITIVGTG